MLRLWQKPLLIREEEYAAYTTAGNYSRVLKSGKTYKITAIGGAAGSLVCYMRKGNGVWRASGGVGGTCQIQLRVNEDMPLAISVGAGGLSKRFQFASSGLSGAGTPGNNTTITFPNGSIVAGGGTLCTCLATSDAAASVTAGTMGTNSINVPGAFNTWNNPTNVISPTDQHPFPDYQATGVQPNWNWPANTNLGAAVICGWNTTAFLIPPSSDGAVIIETVY